MNLFGLGSSSSKDSTPQPTASSSSSEDATSTLRNSSFTRGEGAPSSMDAVTASDLFNASAFDAAKLHPMASIGDKLDYLLLEDDKVNTLPGAGTALPTRGFGDDLCYGTGTTYLTGKSFPKQIDFLTSFEELFLTRPSSPSPVGKSTRSLERPLVAKHFNRSILHRSGHRRTLGTSRRCLPTARGVQLPPSDQQHLKFGDQARLIYG